MNGLLVGIFTAIPILAGTIIGFRRGGKQTLIFVGKSLFAWGLGMGLAAYGLRLGWLWPVGLISPILFGILTAMVLQRLFTRRRSAAGKPRKLGRFQRLSGASLGLALGFVLSVSGWQVALFVDCLATDLPPVSVTRAPAPPPVETQQNSWSSLIDIARQGFLKHLPVAGPLTEDVLAVAQVLKTPIEIRKDFAKHKGWDSLTDLPSLQAIVQDEVLFADIDAAAEGDLVALYRLQKHPLIIEFFREQPLQEILTDLDVKQLASELEEFRNQTPVQGLIADDFQL